MDIAWTKQPWAKCYFHPEPQTGHRIQPSTTVIHVYLQQMRQKKDVVYGLLFLLPDLADLRLANPNINPLSFIIRNL